MKTTVKPTELTDSNFGEIINSGKPVLVDFWAAWCGPCRMLAPTIEELANDFEGEAIIGKLDVDANPHMAGKYNVRSIPTLLIFKKGEVVDQSIGVVPKSTLEAKLKAQIG